MFYRTFYSFQTSTSERNDDKTEDYSDTSEDEEELSIPIAIEGGYGWVVVFASFMFRFLYGGLTMCEGLIFLQLQDKFQTSAQLTALPQAGQQALAFFSGPLMAYIINRYSVRTCFMFGTVLSSLGCILNGFAPNIYFMFFSHVLLQGVGVGMFGSLVIVSHYFDRRRSLAFSFSGAGSGLGSLVIVPLVQFIFETYDFQGAYLLLSTLFMQLFIVAMLYRPLRRHHKFLALERSERKEARKINGEFGEQCYYFQKESIDSKVMSNCKSNTDDVIEFRDKNKRIPTVPGSYLEDGRYLSKMSRKSRMKSIYTIIFPLDHKTTNVSKARPSMFNLHLLKDIPFILFNIGGILVKIATIDIFMFLPSLLLEKNISKTDTSFVLVICGLMVSIGIIIFGTVSNLKIFLNHRPTFYTLLVFVMSLLCILIPNLRGFSSYAALFVLVGLVMGGIELLRFVVLTDIVHKDLFASSMGLSNVFAGVGVLIGPPIGGALKDFLGDFDAAFYLCGGCYALAVCIFGLSFYILKAK